MSDPRVLRFRAGELWVWDESLYCETRYPDGTRAGATRDCEVANRAYAEHLGYLDCWRALVEHEIGHTVVAEGLGWEVSPTLWAVAHDYAPGTAPYERQLWEEAVVLELQRYLRTGETGGALRHPDVAPHYREWARTVARHSATIPDAPGVPA